MQPGGEAQILYSRADGVGTLALHNPARLNALTLGMWQQIPEVLAQAEADDAVRVLIVRGSGDKAFCAGADISEFGEKRSGAASADYNTANNAAFQALHRFPKPTIALIRGVCLGGGFQIAVSCDLRIAAADARFGIPAARLGLGYNPAWIAPLVAAVGAGPAKEMFFTAGRFSADWALRTGFLMKTVEADALDGEAAALAGIIAANAPLTMKAAKAVIDALPHAPDELDALRALAAACFASEDYAEGRAAFMEKRKPDFRGR
jgi:enoyl-CoA hydratase/carnithine racemase